MERIGVLALQGAVTPHLRHIESLGLEGVPVRSPAELDSVERLILPGGESTTMLKLLRSTGLFDAIPHFAKTHPLWGICAGAILIAKRVIHPEQESLGLINIEAERNHYGSQRESFEAEIHVAPLAKPITAQFIRAPQLRALPQSDVKVLASYEGDAVCLQEGRILVSAFHTELSRDSSLHRYFATL